MPELTHIGLDVHKETIAVAVLRPGTSECDESVIANTPEALRRLVARFPDRAALRACYEAGPTGYDTWRLLSALGVPCEVIAPSLIPRHSGAHVKTDRTAEGRRRLADERRPPGGHAPRFHAGQEVGGAPGEARASVLRIGLPSRPPPKQPTVVLGSRVRLRPFGRRPSSIKDVSYPYGPSRSPRSLRVRYR